MARPVAVLNGEGTVSANNAPNPMELAAVSLAILDKRAERTRFLRTINEDIKGLERRQRDIASAIRAGGVQLGLDLFPESAAVLQRSPQAVEDEPAGE